jgi:hypothetical protein
MVVRALVGGHDDARVLGQALHLLLHVARGMCAPVVAPSWSVVQTQRGKYSK